MKTASKIVIGLGAAIAVGLLTKLFTPKIKLKDGTWSAAYSNGAAAGAMANVGEKTNDKLIYNNDGTLSQKAEAGWIGKIIDPETILWWHYNGSGWNDVAGVWKFGVNVASVPNYAQVYSKMLKS